MKPRNEECMRRLRSVLAVVAAVSALWTLTGCGGHSSPKASPYPAKVTLLPGASTSVQLGGEFVFTATAQNAANSNIGATFIFQSSDTSIVNVAPNGIACGGHWDTTYSVCTPGGIGYALVTATALGASSAPTYVFVHPPIDSIQVNGILLSNVPIQEPCLSQSQTMTVEAHAYSQGSDITASVGPFAWSANNAAVVKITPLVSSNQSGTPVFPFATNQATVAAVTPGITQIYATSSGVTSTTFYQPQYQNAQGVTSPPLDFFETCLIQNINLQVGNSGSQQTNQTSFVTSKGTAETATAIITDVMGNSSLAGTDDPIVLSKIPLTWTATQPAVLAAAATCTETCSLSTPSVGAGGVTASCTPPTCNIGFPEVPVALSTPANLATCAAFFQLASCQQFIPGPVYASPSCSPLAGATNPCPVLTPPIPPPAPAAISGLITGTTGATSVLATSTGCQDQNPLDCTTAIYNVSTNRDVAGSATPLPYPPNSLLFDVGGDKAYMGSESAALLINPGNVGTGSNPFTSLGAVAGHVLAVSTNGSQAVFSDSTLNAAPGSAPSQVFIVNTAAFGSPSTVVLNIPNATAAGFSPDGLRTYIFGETSAGAPEIYVYSTIQGLQTLAPAPPAGTTVSTIAFSTNSAFAYVVETPSLGASSVTVYNNCVLNTNSPQAFADTFTLTAPPVAFKVLPDGIHFIALENNGTFDYITAYITPLPAATLTTPGTSLCPMTVAHTKTNITLSQASLDAFDFFPSPDGTQLYLLAKGLPSVFDYHFATGATTGISLINNATPISGSLSADGGTMAVAGSDGMLHEVSTQIGGTDTNPPTSFPYLPDYLNPFCTFTPSTGACTFNLMAVKP
jgi:hypothetical protein